jgi:hypothetical protein
MWGDGVSPLRLVYAPDPEFTDKARRKRLGGTLVVSVDAAGKPHDVRVSRSLAEASKKLRPIALGMDENAVKAVQEYRFEPGSFKASPCPWRPLSRLTIGFVDYSHARLHASQTHERRPTTTRGA